MLKRSNLVVALLVTALLVSPVFTQSNAVSRVKNSSRIDRSSGKTDGKSNVTIERIEEDISGSADDNPGQSPIW